jgi:hypothetical protein
MNCSTNGVITARTWRYFYTSCPNVNQLCNQWSGGYVAAVTVCRQQLW